MLLLGPAVPVLQRQVEQDERDVRLRARSRARLVDGLPEVSEFECRGRIQLAEQTTEEAILVEPPGEGRRSPR
jgi:hypothetical protein